MADKWLIVGLGNPGPVYSHNRHNVGYWCVNRLARLHGIALKARRLYAIGEGSIRGTPVLLAKPRTFMNRSGQAVAAYVLSDPTPQEAEALQASVAQAAEAVETLLREGLEPAMNRYNR